MTRNKNERPKAVSLFSGAGGLDIGVEDAGFEVRCAVEINEYAAKTLELNKWISNASMREFNAWFDEEGAAPYRSWSSDAVKRVRERIAQGVGKHAHVARCAVLQRDIRTVASEEIAAASQVRPGELDLLFGGPPCQSFSRAGQRQAVDDERGQLFLEFVRIARDLKPRWILFENVKGLIQTKANVWRSRCSACGFEKVPPFDADAEVPEPDAASPRCGKCSSRKTSWRVEKQKPGGSLDWVQSAFERIGYRTVVFLLNAADFGAPQRRERVFLLGTRDGEELRMPTPMLSPDKHKTVWDTLFSARNPDHAWPLDPEKALLWVKNVVRPHDEPVTWSLNLPAPTIGAHQGAKLAIAPNGVPEEQLKRQQWHVRGCRQGDTPPVPVDHSYLSDRDLLLLQTFPESWCLAGTRMERAFQIGNAVPPLLAKHVARVLTSAEGTPVRTSSIVRASSATRMDAATKQMTLFGG